MGARCRDVDGVVERKAGRQREKEKVREREKEILKRDGRRISGRARLQ